MIVNECSFIIFCRNYFFPSKHYKDITKPFIADQTEIITSVHLFHIMILLMLWNVPSIIQI